MNRRLALHLGLGAALAVGCASLSAQNRDWPSGPIRIIVPFGPGSGHDQAARLFAEKLTRTVGQPVVIENRAGANGAIGAEAAARAAPDGQTLFLTTQTTQAAAPSLMKKINYDPIRDFEPIGRIANTAALLVVHPSLPVRNLAELVALAKAQPGKLSYASGSAGTLVPAAMLLNAAGIDMVHVKYKSIPQGLTDVMAGHVNMMFTDMATGVPQVKAGKVRAVAISSQQPSVDLPDVPPIARQYPGFELLAWYALYAPAGTPKPIIDRLNTITRAMSTEPALRERLLAMSLEPASSSPAELAAFNRAELEKWTRLIKLAGIEPE